MPELLHSNLSALVSSPVCLANAPRACAGLITETHYAERYNRLQAEFLDAVDAPIALQGSIVPGAGRNLHLLDC